MKKEATTEWVIGESKELFNAELYPDKLSAIKAGIEKYVFSPYFYVGNVVRVSFEKDDYIATDAYLERLIETLENNLGEETETLPTAITAQQKEELTASLQSAIIDWTERNSLLLKCFYVDKKDKVYVENIFQ